MAGSKKWPKCPKCNKNHKVHCGSAAKPKAASKPSAKPAPKKRPARKIRVKPEPKSLDFAKVRVHDTLDAAWEAAGTKDNPFSGAGALVKGVRIHSAGLKGQPNLSAVADKFELSIMTYPGHTAQKGFKGDKGYKAYTEVVVSALGPKPKQDRVETLMEKRFPTGAAAYAAGSKRFLLLTGHTYWPDTPYTDTTLHDKVEIKKFLDATLPGGAPKGLTVDSTIRKLYLADDLAGWQRPADNKLILPLPGRAGHLSIVQRASSFGLAYVKPGSPAKKFGPSMTSFTNAEIAGALWREFGGRPPGSEHTTFVDTGKVRNPGSSWEVRSWSPDETWSHQSLVTTAANAADAIAKVKKRKQGLKGSKRYEAKPEGAWYADEQRAKDRKSRTKNPHKTPKVDSRIKTTAALQALPKGAMVLVSGKAWIREAYGEAMVADGYFDETFVSDDSPGKKDREWDGPHGSGFERLTGVPEKYRVTYLGLESDQG